MKNLFVIFILLFCTSNGLAQETDPKLLRVNISDSTGARIETAIVKAASNSGKTIVCQNKSAGAYLCEIDFEGDFLLTIEAEGFSSLSQTITGLQGSSVTLTLFPSALREDVIVTANRTETRIGETPASIITLSEQELRTTAAPTIDDALRQVPGFSLFRRSGSRNANPTTQGISLRGVGASGAGRSLVMFDDIPLNDPFGGWTQWSRVPPIAVESIEVLRGGASSLYGNNSLSGTVNLRPRRARKKQAFSAEIYGGSQKTFSASTFFGFKTKNWSADFVAANFQTRGYIPIEKMSRGAADTHAGARNSNFSARIEKKFTDKADIFFKTNYFGETRTNGTFLQKNRTHLRQFALGGNLGFANPKSQIPNPKLKWFFYGGTQTFDQTFSAVSDDRNNENLVRQQRVPAQVFGFSGQFSTVFGENQTIIAGFEAREVRGASNETGFFGGRATSQGGAGGRERTYSIFGQDFIRVGERLVLAGSLRYDFWRNFRALNSLRTLSTNTVNTTVFPDRSENAWSPQASILFQATGELSFHALASRSFRAPTLNELYRGFRVGDVITNPNENLRAEKALNFEAGAGFGRNDFFLRANFFYTRIDDPIANVTLSTGNLIIRQRQNIGRTRTSGVEIEAEKRWSALYFSAGYLLTDSRVSQFSANPALEGLRIPQVARHQFTFQTRYANGSGWNLGLQGRALSKQFDDDLNQFRLEPFFQLDVFGAKRFRQNLQVFIGIENVFNSRYSVGRTPVRTVSSPVNGRIGVRWN